MFSSAVRSETSRSGYRQARFSKRARAGQWLNACHYPARQLGIAHVGKDDLPNH
jgi:hypothetical protein